MEWGCKIPSWEMAELEQHAEVDIGAIAEPGCSTRNQASGADCSVDLKLGGSGGSEPPLKWKPQPKMMTPAAATSSSPSKRARAPSSASPVASCSVDGCKADLSDCREYHRRHKVCEIHSKTPIVMVGGVEQRFCQQCSRFHLLAEFDEIKRSCRRRLDGHNRRRRKPQPESITSATIPGTRLSTHGHIYQTPIKPNWTGVVKAEEDAFYTHHHPLPFNGSHQHIPGSFSHCYEGGKQFPFLQHGKPALHRTSMESLLNTVSSVECSSSRSSKIFPDKITRVLDSDCALSLLSLPTQTSSINVGQILPANRVPISQPLVSSLEYCSLNQYAGSITSSNFLPTEYCCSGVEDEQMGGVVDSDTGAGLQCQGMFHVGGEGPGDGVSESLPFSWQ